MDVPRPVGEREGVVLWCGRRISPPEGVVASNPLEVVVAGNKIGQAFHPDELVTRVSGEPLELGVRNRDDTITLDEDRRRPGVLDDLFVIPGIRDFPEREQPSLIGRHPPARAEVPPLSSVWILESALKFGDLILECRKDPPGKIPVSSECVDGLPEVARWRREDTAEG